MCVTTDDWLSMHMRPFADAPIDRALGPNIARQTSIPSYSKALHMLECTHSRPSNGRPTIVLEISLMSVDNQDMLTALRVSQDKPLDRNDAILFDVCIPLAWNIVVTHDQVQPVLTIKLVKQVKDPLVCVTDCGKPPVLPQIVPVAYLDIGESLPIVVLQGI